MNVLAIDTVGSRFSVTVDVGTESFTLIVDSAKQNAERLLPAIDSLFRLAGISATDITLVTCPEGPGSFTGLRLAYATAKAFQLAASCDFFPIPTLECYARPFASCAGAVICAIDAKKNRYYAQVFRRGTAVTESLDASSEDIARLLDAEERVLAVGPDAERLAAELTSILPATRIDVVARSGFEISQTLAEIAKTRHVGYTQDISDYSGPIYVRKSDAETGI